MILDQLFIKHGTDKSSQGHNYSQYYEMFFESLRDHPLNLLEIGVDKGASVRAWKEYFSKATIFGVDLQYLPQYNEERVFMIQADQSKQEDLNRLADVKYDIIIDDASHRGDDQLKTFWSLFPAMNPGGIYVIEDLLCSYDDRWRLPVDIKGFLRDLVDNVNMSGVIPNSRICANKHEAVKLYDGGSYLDRHIEWTFSACGLTFIKKMPA